MVSFEQPWIYEYNILAVYAQQSETILWKLQLFYKLL